MKKTFLAGLATGLLLFGVGGNAMAETISYNELYNPNPDILMVAGQASGSQAWTFDLTDNPGWNTPGQVFSNGTIDLTLDDDTDNRKEKATFAFDGGSSVLHTNINGAPWDSDFEVDFSAFSDGKINATLVATKGDFYFRDAVLNVDSNYTPNGGGDNGGTNPVPEPATMLLVGAGLVGLIGARRKMSA